LRVRQQGAVLAAAPANLGDGFDGVSMKGRSNRGMNTFV
jgi:hypothetical protein